jgi:uncharacterized membrane protein YozB (DUF420 family)
MLYTIIFLSLNGKSLFKTNSNALKMAAGVISTMSTLALFMALRSMKDGNMKYLDHILAANFIGFMFLIVILGLVAFLSKLIWDAEFFSKKGNKLQKFGTILVIIIFGFLTFNSVNTVLIYGHLGIVKGDGDTANGYLLDNFNYDLAGLFGAWELFVIFIILLSLLFWANLRSTNIPSTAKDILFSKKGNKMRDELDFVKKSAEDISEDLIKIQKFLNKNKTKLTERETSY